MSAKPSEKLVAFYFSLEEPRRWAVREALRLEGLGAKADELLLVEDHYRNKHLLLKMSEQMGTNFLEGEELKEPESYKHIIRYEEKQDDVLTIPRSEREAKGTLL